MIGSFKVEGTITITPFFNTWYYNSPNVNAVLILPFYFNNKSSVSFENQKVQFGS